LVGKWVLGWKKERKGSGRNIRSNLRRDVVSKGTVEVTPLSGREAWVVVPSGLEGNLERKNWAKEKGRVSRVL